MNETNPFIGWLTSAAPPTWAIGFAIGVWLFKTWDVWKARLMAIRAGEDAISGNQIARLVEEITRHSTEIKDLKASEQRCREELVMTKERLAQLEGYNLGKGEALNEAQRMLSNEREADRYKGPNK